MINRRLVHPDGTIIKMVYRNGVYSHLVRIATDGTTIKYDYPAHRAIAAMSYCEEFKGFVQENLPELSLRQEYRWCI